MADLAILNTSRGVSLNDPEMSEAYDTETDGTVTNGQPVYIDPTTGQAVPASAAAAATAQFVGVAVGNPHGRKGRTVLTRGRISGYDLTGLNFGDVVYLSDTAGMLADAAGTVNVPVGKVFQIAEAGNPTKCIFIDANMTEAYA